jgi:transposase
MGGEQWDEVRFAVEDCRHVSTRLERALLAAGQMVVRVPPKLMANARSSARTRGKSDPIDALAIARAALQEPDLPIASHDELSREVRLLCDHREDLVAERTRMQKGLRWHLHELDPELDPVARGLNRKTNRHRLARGGNRQLNAALHRIALTQIRLEGPGKLYFQRRRDNGDTTMEALRALKRRLARVVFNLLSAEPAAPRPGFIGV